MSGSKWFIERIPGEIFKNKIKQKSQPLVSANQGSGKWHNHGVTQE